MFWCHACSKNTTVSEFANMCTKCGSYAVERITSDGNNPQQFRPYVIGQPEIPSHNAPNSAIDQQQTVQIPVVLNIRTVLLESIDRPGEFTVIRIVTTGLPFPVDTRTPVSEEVISKLEKVSGVKQCTVCQEQGGCGLKLKCNHTFHQNCLKPWFEQANTCPTCRTAVQ